MDRQRMPRASRDEAPLEDLEAYARMYAIPVESLHPHGIATHPYSTHAADRGHNTMASPGFDFPVASSAADMGGMHGDPNVGTFASSLLYGLHTTQGPHSRDHSVSALADVYHLRNDYSGHPSTYLGPHDPHPPPLWPVSYRRSGEAEWVPMHMHDARIGPTRSRHYTADVAHSALPSWPDPGPQVGLSQARSAPSTFTGLDHRPRVYSASGAEPVHAPHAAFLESQHSAPAPQEQARGFTAAPSDSKYHAFIEAQARRFADHDPSPTGHTDASMPSAGPPMHGGHAHAAAGEDPQRHGLSSQHAPPRFARAAGHAVAPARFHDIGGQGALESGHAQMGGHAYEHEGPAWHDPHRTRAPSQERGHRVRPCSDGVRGMRGPVHGRRGVAATEEGSTEESSVREDVSQLWSRSGAATGTTSAAELGSTERLHAVKAGPAAAMQMSQGASTSHNATHRSTGSERGRRRNSPGTRQGKSGPASPQRQAAVVRLAGLQEYQTHRAIEPPAHGVQVQADAQMHMHTMRAGELRDAGELQGRAGWDFQLRQGGPRDWHQSGAHPPMEVPLYSPSNVGHTAVRGLAEQAGRSSHAGEGPQALLRVADRTLELQYLNKLKALLSQCVPTVEAFTEALMRSDTLCTLPMITKLVSKFNKSGQWQRGLALFRSLPAIGLEADAQMANAALGSCARGGDAGAAWTLYRYMGDRSLALDTISFRALLAALSKGGEWMKCLQVFMHAIEVGVQLEASSVMLTIIALDRAGRWPLAEAAFAAAFLCICDLTSLLCLPMNPEQPPLQLQPLPSRGDARASRTHSIAAGDEHMTRSMPEGAVAGNNAVGVWLQGGRVVHGDGSGGDGAGRVAVSMAAGLDDPRGLRLAEGAPAASGARVAPPQEYGGPQALPEALAHASGGTAPQPPSAQPVLGMLANIHMPDPSEDESAAALLRSLVALRWRVLLHRDSGVDHAALLLLMEADAKSLPSQQGGPAAAAAQAAGLRGLAEGGGQSAALELVAQTVESIQAAGASAEVWSNGGSPAAASEQPRPSTARHSMDGSGIAAGARGAGSTERASPRRASSHSALAQRSAGDTGDGPELHAAHAYAASDVQLPLETGAATLTDRAVRSLKGLRKDVLTRACCHAMLLTYLHASPPQVARAAQLLSCMRQSAGPVAPDVVCCNIVIDMHARTADLPGGLKVLLDVYSDGLEPTASTFGPLLEVAITQAASDGLQVVEHLARLMHSSAIEPDDRCIAALCNAGRLIQAPPPPPSSHPESSEAAAMWMMGSEFGEGGPAATLSPRSPSNARRSFSNFGAIEGRR